MPARTPLFTEEDTFNGHKLLGFACLSHYVFRFTRAGERDMDFAGTVSSLLCILLHACLSLSSLIFKVPRKRIKDGSRIWPEYRLHSIIFAVRSLACMLLMWTEKRFNLEPMYFCNVAIVFATMAAADAASKLYADVHSSTIQDLQTTPGVRFFFSAMQVYGTAHVLVGVRRFTAQFVFVFIVQITAFMMTLRRKNVISHRMWVVLYGLLLGTGFAFSWQDIAVFGPAGAIKGMAGAVAGVAGVARLLLGCNKYVLWGVCAVVVNVARRYPPAFWEGNGAWPALNLAAMAALVVGGYRKTRRANAHAARSAAVTSSGTTSKKDT